MTAVHDVAAPAAPAAVTLRPATDGDEAFLRVVYADARADEVAAFGWPAAEVDAFLTIQFDAQRRHLRAVHPDSVDAVVMVGDEPAGRLWTHHDEALTVIDIALLARHRGAGVGGGLLRDLQADAAARAVPVELKVLRTNRARHLYERLGFRPIMVDGGVDGTVGGTVEDSQRLALRWNPPGPTEWTAAIGVAGRLGGVPAVVVDCSVPLVQGPYERYGVRFRVPADTPFGPGTHRFTHPTVGTVDVLVGPGAPASAGLVLTATFVRTAR